MNKLDIIAKKRSYIDKNIALIGHMGSGKSLIGKLIAKKLDFKHLDSDKLIEKITNSKIKEIFSKDGEEKFREIEEKVIADLIGEKNLVLSLGGGSILSQKTRDFLKKYFITIFLDIDVKILVERLKNNTKRPLLLNGDIEKKINQLDQVRRKYYLLANIILKDHETPSELVEMIIQKYKKKIKNNK